MPLPDLNSLNPQVSESYSSEKRFPLKPILIILVIVLLLGSGFYIFNRFNSNSANQNNNQPQITQSDDNPPAPGVIAKVGEELIYQKDLDLELAISPPIGTPEERKKRLLDKIATDSALLQGAKAEGLITNLDADIYNSPNKDYLKRLKTIENVREKASQQVSRLEGYMVSLWFMNDGKIGPLGYNRAKELAFEKISALQQEVKQGKITAEQAADRIRNDPSNRELDELYKSNAGAKFNFNIKDGYYKKELFDPLFKLNNGDTSDVLLLTEVGQDRPGYYTFATITDKVSNGKFSSFEEWLDSVKKKYEITLY